MLQLIANSNKGIVANKNGEEMKKNISFFYGYASPYQERVQKIINAGYDGVMVLYEFSKTFYQECDLILASNLNIESIHLPYKGIVNNIWREGKGSQFVSTICQGIDYADKMGIKKVTMHTSSSPFPPPKNVCGIQIVQKVLKYAEDKNVTICIENLRRSDYFDYIMENIPNTALKVCFDSGHANAFYKNATLFPFEKYKNRISCCHLHDNLGLFDSHNLPFDGNIDWNFVANRLSQCKDLNELTIEAGVNKNASKTISEEVFLNEGFARLQRIEKLMRIGE